MGSQGEIGIFSSASFYIKTNVVSSFRERPQTTLSLNENVMGFGI